MAVVFYIWLIPLALVVGGGLVSLYLCVKRDWQVESEAENRSDLEIALELEAREAAEEAAHAHRPMPLATATGDHRS